MGKVPFLWENSPGVRKMTSFKETSKSQRLPQEQHGLMKLPPPPCLQGRPKAVLHDLRVPLPPCPFQPPLRSSSKRELDKIREDPFLAAYMECTKNGGQPRSRSIKKDGIGRVMKVRMDMFSCKFSSCGVKEDGLARMVHQPLPLRSRSAKIE